ncbi:MAG: hypothetical protein ABJA83_11115 [Burkholderiaceae bacterium]
MNTTTEITIVEEQLVVDQTVEIELSLHDLDIVGGGSVIDIFQ